MRHMKCKIGAVSVVLIAFLTFITNSLTLLVTGNCFPFLPTASLIALGFVVAVTIAKLYISLVLPSKKQPPTKTTCDDDSWMDNGTYISGQGTTEFNCIVED